tara:strand:+ start:563 stop:667 length:105 start_codon:yes stop_codon:yes gene_type:complete
MVSFAAIPKAKNFPKFEPSLVVVLLAEVIFQTIA